MTSTELKRGEVKVQIEGDLILTGSEQNILPFRMVCRQYGAAAIISKPISSKKDIDFHDDDAPIIASLTGAKILNDLEKNEKVVAYALDTNNIDEEEIKTIVDKTTKPLLMIFRDESEIKNYMKFCNGIIFEFKEGDKELPIDFKIVNSIKEKYKVPLFVLGEEKVPEDIYAALKKTECDAVIIGDIALIQPVIFEQTHNYFEKGYYNKITRKRREKTVNAFEKAWKKYGEGYDSKIKDELIEKFMEE